MEATVHLDGRTTDASDVAESRYHQIRGVEFLCSEGELTALYKFEIDLIDEFQRCLEKISRRQNYLFSISAADLSNY